MRTFQVKAYGQTGFASHPDSIEARIHGYRALGSGVLVVEEGSGWVTLQDGSRQDLSAKSVILWETGDWVEYGSNGPSGFQAREYWAAVERAEDSQARLDEIFGDGAP